jgi:hypothetical protein
MLMAGTVSAILEYQRAIKAIASGSRMGREALPAKNVAYALRQGLKRNAKL